MFEQIDERPQLELADHALSEWWSAAGPQTEAKSFLNGEPSRWAESSPSGPGRLARLGARESQRRLAVRPKP
jgi:acyl carrier protein phosphodiesterase